MPKVIEKKLPPPAIVVAHDRRRPAQREYANPYLLRLLRRISHGELSEGAKDSGLDVDPNHSDRLALTRGIGIGLLLSIAIWGGLASAIWFFLRWKGLF
jgi:hypothetical protein